MTTESTKKVKSNQSDVELIEVCGRVFDDPELAHLWWLAVLVDLDPIDLDRDDDQDEWEDGQ